MTGDRLDLTGKVALVTGASKGIGAAIARIYAEQGAQVMLSSRKQEALEATAATIDGTTAVFAANAGRPEQAEACVAATIERFGRLDILVNNAATNPYYGRAIDIDLPRFDKTIEVNIRGPFVWAQEAWKQWMEANGGGIINISSVGGLQYHGPIGIYDLTKAALIHLTKHLASRAGPGRAGQRHRPRFGQDRLRPSSVGTGRRRGQVSVAAQTTGATDRHRRSSSLSGQ